MLKKYFHVSYRQTLVSCNHTAALFVEVHVLVDLNGGQAPGPLDHVTGQQGLLLPCQNSTVNLTHTADKYMDMYVVQNDLGMANVDAW